MCFHSMVEYRAWASQRKEAAQKAAGKEKAGKGHQKTEEKYAAIILRDEKGGWVAAWHCDPRDAQDVANVILDLKTWHAGEYRYVDMTDVDTERAKLKLTPLDQDGLPIANRLPRESVDKLVEEWDLDNKTAIPHGGVGRIARSLKAQAEEKAQREAEAAALARELGVEVKELRTR